MKLVVAIWASARISTGGKLLKLVVVTLGKIPHKGGVKILYLYVFVVAQNTIFEGLEPLWELKRKPLGLKSALNLK